MIRSESLNNNQLNVVFKFSRRYSLREPWFDPGPFRVMYVEGKVTLSQVVIVLLFSPLSNILQCSLLILILIIFLSVGRADED